MIRVPLIAMAASGIFLATGDEPLGWGKLLADGGALGILGLSAYYILAKHIPAMIQQHSRQMQAEQARHQQVIENVLRDSAANRAAFEESIRQLKEERVECMKGREAALDEIRKACEKN